MILLRLNIFIFIKVLVSLFYKESRIASIVDANKEYKRLLKEGGKKTNIFYDLFLKLIKK
tara:strand:+ start:142 stop:321 length:180 start_codon:yes stop_codon:yes gene_type:complete